MYLLAKKKKMLRFSEKKAVLSQSYFKPQLVSRSINSYFKKQGDVIVGFLPFRFAYHKVLLQGSYFIQFWAFIFVESTSKNKLISK